MAPAKLLDQKVALVTGAASGIGEGIATLFAAEGCKVIVADINEDGGNRVTKAITKDGDIASFVRLDITASADWRHALEFAKQTYGGLDILVNNAATSHQIMGTLEVTEEEFDRVFNTNVRSLFHSIKVIVPHFLERGGGDIINIESCVKEYPYPGLTWYGASKGAVNMVTRHLSNEFAPRGIRVNAVSPSICETPLMMDTMGSSLNDDVRAALVSKVPLQRLSTPEDLAKAALYVASPFFNKYKTGANVRVDGGQFA